MTKLNHTSKQDAIKMCIKHDESVCLLLLVTGGSSRGGHLALAYC
jgi:hypothetical protein